MANGKIGRQAAYLPGRCLRDGVGGRNGNSRLLAGQFSAPKLIAKAAGAIAQNVTRRPNAAEWVARKAEWNFECKTRSPSDLPNTAESWRRRSVANHPLLRAVDTTAHFEPARHSHLGFRRQRE